MDFERVELLGLTRSRLEGYFAGMGERSFRAKQILKWIYRSGLRDFEPMTDLPIPLRIRLAEKTRIGRPEIIAAEKSSDGATKLVLELEDGLSVEAVHIPSGDRETACLSTQAGCALGCSFCATGSMGLQRNLTPAEIIGQFMVLEEKLEVELTNVVFMGMGEPLLNLDAVIDAIKILTDDCAFGMGHRRIIVSTVGIPDKIDLLLETGLKPKLAISLNAPNEELRRKLMPKATELANIDEILESASRYARDTARWFTAEYVLLKGINDSLLMADELAELLSPLPCKVNLIPYNPVEGARFSRPGEETITRFQGYLLAAGITATVRESAGNSVSAACGQLAR